MPLASKPEQRLDGVDALRGVAAILVMLDHYSSGYEYYHGRHLGAGLSYNLAHGHLGVELFFLISGFVICMTLQRTEDARTFAVSRVTRLFPGYFAALTYTLVGTAVLGALPLFLNAGTLVANLTMVPDLLGAKPIDGSYWTLLYEWSFYGLAACTLLPARRRTPELWCALWLAVTMAMCLYGLDRFPMQVTQLTGAPFAHLFVAGVMLYRVHAGQATKWTWILLVLALELNMGEPPPTQVPLPREWYAATVVGFAGTIFLASRWQSRGRWMAVPRFFGDISYPLYLVHQAVGVALIERLEKAGISPDLAVATAILLSVLVAWTIALRVERPVRAWRRARLGGVQANSGGLGAARV